MSDALFLFIFTMVVFWIIGIVVDVFLRRDVFAAAVLFLCFGALIGEVWGPVEHMRCATDPSHSLCQSVASTEGGAQ